MVGRHAARLTRDRWQRGSDAIDTDSREAKGSVTKSYCGGFSHSKGCCLFYRTSWTFNKLAALAAGDCLEIDVTSNIQPEAQPQTPPKEQTSDRNQRFSDSSSF